MFDFERAPDYIRSLELTVSALSEEIQKDSPYRGGAGTKKFIPQADICPDPVF